MTYSVKTILVLLLPILVLAQAPVQIYSYRNFSGGMVSDFDIIDMENKYYEWCLNFNIDHGRLESRQGYAEDLDLAELGCDPDTGIARLMAAYYYSISKPNAEYNELGNGLIDISKDGMVKWVAILDSLERGDPDYEAVKVYMRPKYNSVSQADSISQGAWTDEWSVDFNNPLNAPRRVEYLTISQIEDIQVNGGVLRATTGCYKDEGKINPYVDEYTYPWWFGYIGRYFWFYSNIVADPYVDGFRLYESALYRPELSVIDEIILEASENVTPLPPSVDLGRYFFRCVYEYDGFQYSVPIDTAYYIDVLNDTSVIVLTLRIDPEEINDRLTAVILFSTDALISTNPGFSGFWVTPSIERRKSIQAGSDPFKARIVDFPDSTAWLKELYYFRRRIVVADADSNKLGYEYRADKIRYLWGRSLLPDTTYTCYVFLDRDDIDMLQQEMYSYLDQESKEVIALPKYMANIGNYMWGGNVRVDSRESNIKDYFSNQVIISPLNQLDCLPANNFIWVGQDNTSQVTCIKNLNGYALIWTNDAFEIWKYDKVPLLINVFRNAGTISHRSVQVTTHGVFWANVNGIYQYNPGESFSGVPHLITPLVETIYDSLVYDYDNSDIDIDYATSLYVPTKQRYILTCGTAYAGLPDSLTLYLSNWGGSIPCPRKYGGRKSMVYNILDQSWVKYYWSSTNVLRDYFTSHLGQIYCYTPHNTFYFGKNLGSNILQDDLLDFNCEWVSGWTDLGEHNIEKDVIGLELDFEAGFTLVPFDPDMVIVTSYADGRDSPYDIYYFYDSESTMTDKNIRRVKYVKSDSTGHTITDPSNHLPIYYKFKIEYNDATKSEYPLIINELRVHYVSRKYRSGSR